MLGTLVTRDGICLKHHWRFTCKDMFPKGSERKISFIIHCQGSQRKGTDATESRSTTGEKTSHSFVGSIEPFSESMNRSYATFIDAHKAKRSREPVMLEIAMVLVLNGIGICSDMLHPSCRFRKIAAYPGLTSNLLGGGGRLPWPLHTFTTACRSPGCRVPS